MRNIKILIFYFMILTPIYAFENLYFDSLALKISPSINRFESSFTLIKDTVHLIGQIDNKIPNFSSSQDVIKPFESDGCSLFPDGTYKNKNLWCDCCLNHDIAYWKGGTFEERLQADKALRDCILEKTGDLILVEIVYKGVRFGGSWIFPTWYRWGYGWSYGRGYKALSEEEKKMTEQKLEDYNKSNKPYICDKK